LKKNTQKKIFNFLLKMGIKNFVGVPDSTMKHFIEEGIVKKKIIFTTREEEAIGICTGMVLSGEPSLVFMQNAGFANSLSTITSLVELYKIPLILLIGWRGFLKNDAPEHEKIGKIQPELIKSLDISSRILDENNWEKNCKWAIKNNSQGKLCALIMKRDFVD